MAGRSARGEGDLVIGEPALLGDVRSLRSRPLLEPQGLGGRIYRLPPLPPTPCLFRFVFFKDLLYCVVLCCVA